MGPVEQDTPYPCVSMHTVRKHGKTQRDFVCMRPHTNSGFSMLSFNVYAGIELLGPLAQVLKFAAQLRKSKPRNLGPRAGPNVKFKIGGWDFNATAGCFSQRYNMRMHIKQI